MLVLTKLALILQQASHRLQLKTSQPLAQSHRVQDLREVRQ